jgi:hypothetical protein
MVTIGNETFYTIDEVVDLSGYQKNTIYNFTTEGIISPPIKGLVEADYQSQGLYRLIVLDELQNYMNLKCLGMKKQDIIALIKTMRATNEQLLPILETRG